MNYDKEISILQIQNQIQANEIINANKKIDKLEEFIANELNAIKLQNEKLQESIDDFVAKRNFLQGFIKAVVVIAGIFGFSFTAWLKLK